MGNDKRFEENWCNFEILIITSTRINFRRNTPRLLDLQSLQRDVPPSTVKPTLPHPTLIIRVKSVLAFLHEPHKFEAGNVHLISAENFAIWRGLAGLFQLQVVLWNPAMKQSLQLEEYYKLLRLFVDKEKILTLQVQLNCYCCVKWSCTAFIFYYIRLLVQSTV